VWQDAFENGKDDLDEGTIIEVWKDWGHPGWKGMLKKVRNTENLKKTHTIFVKYETYLFFRLQRTIV
jgi:hypothetical protein